MKNNFRDWKRLVSVFLTLTMIFIFSPINVLAVKSDDVQSSLENRTELNEKDNVKEVPNTDIKKVKSKLDTQLLKLIDKQSMSISESKQSLKSEMQVANQFVPKGVSIKNDKNTAKDDVVFVYIKTKTSEGLKSIQPYVYKMMHEDVNNKLMSAWVQVSELERIESIDEVLNLETVIQPKVNTTSQGDSFHRANMVRALTNGSDGSGVKVGVISDGVDHLANSIALGELNSLKTHVLDNAIGGDEGTAMLEIIHDLAPGAELYFHDASTDNIGFNSAIDDLVAAGCKIIVDDISYIGEPYFEDGIISTHIRQVVNNYDINYISSAGNSAENHYQGMFYNDGNNYHDFSGGSSSLKGIYIKIKPGDTIQTVLQWNDPVGGSSNDYDLFMKDTITNKQLDYSTNTQAGRSNPIEAFQYTNNTGSTINAEIKIQNPYGRAASKMLELYVFGGVCKNINIVKSDSIFGQAAIPEVITVGGIDVSRPNEIASYSSQGPVTLRNGVVRQKPDICGATGVSVSGVGGFPSDFHGTSASAPHIAAIAALLRSKYPEKTGIQIRDLIQNSAVDLGTPGLDNIFGYGKADAYNAFIKANSVDSRLASNVTRLSGQDRVETSLAIAKEEFRDNAPDGVILTTANNFPDALSGADLAFKYNAPIILVNNTVSDSRNTLDYITNNVAKGKNIYILGGTGVVSMEVSDYLINNGYIIVRLGGKDRYETNQNIVDNLNVTKGTPIVMATGEGFADALSVSSIAALKGYPILLNTKDNLLSNVRNNIINIQPTTVYIIGGTGVISSNIEDEILNLNTNIKIVRLGGQDRYETSMKIADYFNLSTDTITLATGEDFPDALSGSLLAGKKNSSILLLNNNDTSRQKDLIKRHNIKNLIVFGGEGVLRKDTVDSLIQN